MFLQDELKVIKLKINDDGIVIGAETVIHIVDFRRVTVIFYDLGD